MVGRKNSDVDVQLDQMSRLFDDVDANRDALVQRKRSG
jgi:hypothetical protein